jgi:23S rRNA pseudouridine2457 synthase
VTNLRLQRGKRLLLFYKPYGVLSQFTGEPGQRTLAEFEIPKGLYAAGRLDADSEGLLAITDDGALIHQLLDPAFEHPRTYWAQVEGVLEEDALATLRRGGLAIENYRTRPCHARRIEEPALPPRDPPIRVRKSVPDSWLELILHEGKNRQVRKMTAAVGHPTLRLVRAAIGEWRLDGLSPGEWKLIG